LFGHRLIVFKILSSSTKIFVHVNAAIMSPLPHNSFGSLLGNKAGHDNHIPNHNSHNDMDENNNVANPAWILVSQEGVWWAESKEIHSIINTLNLGY